jgi:hypothetical protein
MVKFNWSNHGWTGHCVVCDMRQSLVLVNHHMPRFGLKDFWYVSSTVASEFQSYRDETGLFHRAQITRILDYIWRHKTEALRFFFS